MHMPNQVNEAARQIAEHASDIHGALALAGRFDLVKLAVKIQKKAQCIRQMEQPGVSQLAGCRNDLLNGINTLGHVIARAESEMREDVSDEDLLTIIRTAEVVVKRGFTYMELVIKAESGPSQDLENSIMGDDYNDYA